MATAVKPLKVTERVVDAKRHTIGYIISGSEVSRSEAVKLAQRGWIRNARVARGNGGTYIVGDNTNLYDLPIRIGR